MSLTVPLWACPIAAVAYAVAGFLVMTWGVSREGPVDTSMSPTSRAVAAEAAAVWVVASAVGAGLCVGLRLATWNSWFDSVRDLTLDQRWTLGLGGVGYAVLTLLLVGAAPAWFRGERDTGRTSSSPSSDGSRLRALVGRTRERTRGPDVGIPSFEGRQAYFVLPAMTALLLAPSGPRR